MHIFVTNRREGNFKITDMKFLNVLENRYTTKKYDASKKVSESDILELMEALRLSPSSINSQNTE